MENYLAHASSRQIHRGMTLAIHSGVLRRDDVLNVQMPEDGMLRAVVERFEVTGLYLSMNGKRLICRPWRTGDASTGRVCGTLSKWTVDQIEEGAAALL